MRKMMSNEIDLKERAFLARSEEEQKDFLKYTWCNSCLEVDLGMQNAKEFQADNKVWIEGDCLKCGDKVVTEIDEEG